MAKIMSAWRQNRGNYKPSVAKAGAFEGMSANRKNNITMATEPDKTRDRMINEKKRRSPQGSHFTIKTHRYEVHTHDSYKWNLVVHVNLLLQAVVTFSLNLTDFLNVIVTRRPLRFTVIVTFIN